MDLSNDWLRRDVGTNSVYYGYSTSLTSGDADKNWAILKISTVGTVDSVSWNDNYKFEYIAKWSERVQNFTTPSGSLGITYSTVNDTFSNVSINTSWSFLSGVNTYKVIVTDQNGVLYGSIKRPANIPFLNGYGGERITEKVFTNSYMFVGTTGMTYSINITGVNSVGTTSSSVIVTT
jgi:hypothetical protein